MKFFTPDLISRFGSDDADTALAAQGELERRANEYLQSVGEVERKLPERFRELFSRYYLHDVRVMDNSFAASGNGLPLEDLAMGVCASSWRPADSAKDRLASFCIVLELDTPPRDVIVLQYRSVHLEKGIHHPSLRGDECPCLEWQYDEIELADGTGSNECRHSILFTNGFELRLRFEDFDFATLKPIASGSELSEAER